MLDEHLRFEGLVLIGISFGDKINSSTYSVSKSLKPLQTINLLLFQQSAFVSF